MKIIAVVPTYNRPELLKKNLNCLLSQSRPLDKIVLVDNASESDTATMLKDCGYFDIEKIVYIRLDINTGASGGFRCGLIKAMEFGADWIWGMDDDAFPESQALQKILDVNADGIHDCLWSNVDEDMDFTSEIKKVDHLIFVGFFISKKLVNLVGYPDLKFYMYHDDTDYSNRIIENGFNIIKVRESIINHKGFDKRGGNPITTYKLGPLSFKVLNCEPYRIYYIFRNNIFASKGFLNKSRGFLKSILVDAPKYAFTRPRSSMALCLGLWHAMLGKSGKVSLPVIFEKNYYK